MWGILLSIYETECNLYKNRDKWWGLPLFLPSLILPIFATLILSRIFLPVRFFSFICLCTDDQHDDVFQLGGIARDHLGIFVRKYAELGFYETLSLTAILLSLSFSVGAVTGSLLPGEQRFTW